MRTPTHFSIGQEAVAVGVCAALAREDAIYSGHRCHAHNHAKGGDLDAMVAELYGKETGCARGRGGSVHLSDPAAGVLASSAILGQTMAVAVGTALAFRPDGIRCCATLVYRHALAVDETGECLAMGSTTGGL
jgi:pyruvate dehydrogenase E1 component alpha subunit